MKYFILFLIFSFSAFAEAPIILNKNLKSPPPRIIRMCCSFGADLKVAGMPFVKITDITEISKIGVHKYLGAKEENNGIVYTQNGGFIDLGHLRDIADFTGYLYSYIQSEKEKEEFSLKLGNEAGMKTVFFKINANISEHDAAHLAGKIAYDLSVWHEISTFYGSSYIPMVPERYSSFSLEDAYSNLLGVHLGIKAILSDQSFEESMTILINETLEKLEVVQSREETYEAMLAVRDIWWSGKAKLPSRKVLIKRQFAVYDCVYPLLIDEENIQNREANKVCVPENTLGGIPLNKYYSLSIKANFKIPVKKVFGDNVKEKNIITQLDFPALIKYAENETIKELALNNVY
jgi:hypothetical protein